MRRHGRGTGGGTMHAHRPNGSQVPDSLSLIRSYDSESMPTRPVRPSPLTASTIQGLPLDLLDRIRSFPLFDSAPDSFLAEIGAHLRPQLYSPHDYILTEGDDAKAMYWLVRGAVRVTSRDGESTYAELKPGAFFGEIGILMNIPRTACIVANLKSLVVRLNKEDLAKVLPSYPDVERAIREEAQERLTILERKKKESASQQSATGNGSLTGSFTQHTTAGLDPGLKVFGPRAGKRPRESADGDVLMAEAGMTVDDGMYAVAKKRKSPSPSLAEAAASSALGSGSVNVRQTLRELPLFASLPPEILHFLGLKAIPKTYPPFTEIVKQGSQGRDVFFIIRGEVEVVDEDMLQQPQPQSRRGSATSGVLETHVKARLKAGQYFGEVASLSLAPLRTATVRSVSAVECLMITGDVLNELWQRCPPDIRAQVENTAKQRLGVADGADVSMTDAEGTPAIDELAIADMAPRSPRTMQLPSVTFTEPFQDSPTNGERNVIEQIDPDPYLNPELDSMQMRSKSRRGSLAPPSPASPAQPSSPSPSDSSDAGSTNGHMITTVLHLKHDVTPPEPHSAYKRAKLFRTPHKAQRSPLPDSILVRIFDHLPLLPLMRARRVCLHWHKLISTSPDLLHVLDLSPYNRDVTDAAIVTIIAPFAARRPQSVDLSNCFHVTDEGFAALAAACSPNVRAWRMKSVWDITGQAVLDMVNKAKALEEIDLSNCRKVGDNLLARVIGWVVPDVSASLAHQQQVAAKANGANRGQPQQQQRKPQQGGHPLQASANALPPGTVVGCPSLKRLTLSYCKHITDRSMAHIAAHAAQRIESMDLTRCTTITDAGFQQWSVYPFPRLTKLVLADCTYLTDNAIIYLTHTAKALKELDLSFCCALSDVATEVLALGCPALTSLNLAFCGSAVSDASLRAIGLHLLDLRYLSVRGCVRVTGLGVEAVVAGCTELESFDVSQCKNLQGWLDGGGVERVNRNPARRRRKDGQRGVRFEVVADGRWRTGT